MKITNPNRTNRLSPWTMQIFLSRGGTIRSKQMSNTAPMSNTASHPCTHPTVDCYFSTTYLRGRACGTQNTRRNTNKKPCPIKDLRALRSVIRPVRSVRRVRFGPAYRELNCRSIYDLSASISWYRRYCVAVFFCLGVLERPLGGRSGSCWIWHRNWPALTWLEAEEGRHNEVWKILPAWSSTVHSV